MSSCSKGVCLSFLRGLLTHLEHLFGVERFTEKFLHVSSQQEDGGHQSHQHPGEDDAEPDAAVEETRRPSGTDQIHTVKQ